MTGLRRLSGPARAEAGQASVEIVALVPALVLAGAAIFTVLSAGAARELAGHAAEAGAIAVAEGGDPRRAARAAVPGWGRSRLDVEVRGTRVEVRLRPPALLPGLGDLLTAGETADAGRVR